ncbi:MAG: ABC-type transport auxiliary lipoprotein family protein [Polyangiales bacterium]
MNKNDSVVFRYFSPAHISGPTEASAPAPTVGPTLQLRLGRVSSASHIKDKIAFRNSDYEIGFYEQLRWTERPDAYLRRAMSRALFEDEHVQQLVSGPGLTLEIELEAFEELRAPRHAARVEVAWMLRNEQVVVRQKTLVVEKAIESPASDTDASAVATSMADALGEAIHMMVSSVVAELSRAR